MKNYLIILASATLLFSACNRADRNLSNYERDSLLTVLSYRDSSIIDFISSFNEVESRLDSIAIKQHIIYTNTSKSGVELRGDQKTLINAQISAINKLMDKNQKSLVQLNLKLKKSTSKNEQLEKTIAIMNKQLIQKNVELAMLNEVLYMFHGEIEQLQVTVGELRETLDAQGIALHTAYFVIGKTKDLQKISVIDRKGGLLGVGRTSKITDNVDNKNFIKIDFTKTVRIAINSREMKIITSHPNDSYKLDKDPKDEKMIESILITNPEKFWSASKYLVIVRG